MKTTQRQDIFSVYTIWDFAQNVLDQGAGPKKSGVYGVVEKYPSAALFSRLRSSFSHNLNSGPRLPHALHLSIFEQHLL
jgi:hypothetical protein